MKRFGAEVATFGKPGAEGGRPDGPLALCQSHWDRLRLEIEQRGLPVAPSSEALVEWLDEGRTDALFDAFIDIIEHVLDRVGPVALMWRECPLDIMNKQHEEHHKQVGGRTSGGEECSLEPVNGFDVWLKYAADAQVVLRTGQDPEMVH